MNIEERQRLTDLLHYNLEALKAQKLMLDCLYQAGQHLWNADEPRDRCNQLERMVALETVKAVAIIVDLSDRLAGRVAERASEAVEAAPDDFPF